MINYSWTIDSVDEATACMLVTFRRGDSAIQYNLPAPTVGVDLAEHVRQYAPIQQWATSIRPLQNLVGQSGEDTVDEAPVVSTNEAPIIIGSPTEEYLRALVYQVIAEMKDDEV